MKDGDKVNLISRNRNELKGRFPEIAAAVQGISGRECVLDGEVVALDEAGRSSFQLLQALEMEGRKSPVRFYVFDLLQLEGKSLLQLPLPSAKSCFGKSAKKLPIQFVIPASLGATPKILLAEVKRRGLGGDYRQATGFRLRTGPAQRRLDQTKSG